MSRTIFLIEDDAALRRALAAALRRHDYEVMEAGLASVGLERLAEAGASLDLVLTDVSLWPEGAGELREAMAEHHPGTALLFMSGYQKEELVARGLLSGDEPFLKKPFQPTDLLRRIQEALGEE